MGQKGAVQGVSYSNYRCCPMCHQSKTWANFLSKRAGWLNMIKNGIAIKVRGNGLVTCCLTCLCNMLSNNLCQVLCTMFVFHVLWVINDWFGLCVLFVGMTI